MNNKADILFSIIIPTYNRAHTLERAIQSVLTQTYQNFELLIVDDGSTDNTNEIVERIADKRICYYKKKNEERNIARNFGVSHAQGDYVCFLDSDDYLLPNHFRTAYNVAKKRDQPEVFHLGYRLVDENDKVLVPHKYLPNNIDTVLIKENPLSCNAIFLRRDIALKYRFIASRDAIVSEDWYVWLRLAARFHIYVEDTVTSVIVQHGQRSIDDISANKLARGTDEIVTNLLSDRAFCNKYQAYIPSLLSFKYGLVAMALASNKEKITAIHYLGKALRAHPLSITSPRVLATFKHLLFS